MNMKNFQEIYFSEYIGVPPPKCNHGANFSQGYAVMRLCSTYWVVLGWLIDPV